MTPNCSLNKHATRNLFLFTLRKNLPLIILGTAFAALLCPGLVLTHISSSLPHLGFGKPLNLRVAILLIIPAVTLLSSAFASILSLVNLSYLYKKPACDLFHSLPITRAGLLTARFSAAIVSAFAPLLMCYGSFTLIGLYPLIEVDFGLLWQGFLISVAATLISATTTLLFQVFAGNLFSFFASYACFNIGVPALVLLTSLLCDRLWFGFTINWSMLQHATPFAFTVSTLLPLLSGGPNILSWDVLWSVLIAAGLFGVSLLLYNRRRSERSGQTYAFRAVYWILSGLLGFLCGFFLGFLFNGGDLELSFDFWLYGAIGAILSTVSFGALTDKGFKTVKRSLLIGGCAYAALIVYCLVIHFDLVGYQRYVPAPDQVASVEIEGTYYNGNPLVLTDPTDLIAMHQEIVDTGNRESSYYNKITITYHLKDGRTIKRAYSNLIVQAYHELRQSNSYSDAVFEKFNPEKNQSSTFYIQKRNGGYVGYKKHLLRDNQVKPLLTYYFELLRQQKNAENMYSDPNCKIFTLYMETNLGQTTYMQLPLPAYAQSLFEQQLQKLS